jgi:hypothetical protein
MITTKELQQFDAATRRRVAERVKEEMKKRGMCGGRLATLAEVAPSTVNDILNEGNWTCKSVTAVLYVLDIPLYIL